jgi:TatD DNase family protein
MILIDSHAHLDSPEYDRDRPAMLGRARRAGVEIIINPGVDLASSHKAIELSAQEKGIYAAVGVHPHDAAKLDTEASAELRRLANQPRVVAIGEIGLDFYRNLAPCGKQREAFERQLALAAELRLPVIIHQRAAQDDMMAMLRSWVAGARTTPTGYHPSGVLHCFSGDMAMAEEAIDLGFYLGIGGPVTFTLRCASGTGKNARSLPAIVRKAPLERLLLETDSPYLAPHPHRGKRNEPAYLALIVQSVALLQDKTPEEVAAATTANGQSFFNLADGVVK